MTKPVIAYRRLSKERKGGKPPLGLDAQQAAIDAFCSVEGYGVEGAYSEIETGKGFDALERRPELAKALAAAKARGVVLGNAKQAQANADFADDFAETMRPHVALVLNLSLTRIAAYLNGQNIATPLGGRWQSETVRRLLKRLERNAVA